jgi:3-oxoacyl-(acyl-carrier-protein) synthase
MKRRRVKITGIGPVTPAGIGREAFESGIFEMVSRIRPFTKLGDEFGPFVAGFIDRFRLEEYVDRNAIPKCAARHTQFAAAGALLALRDASIDVDSLSDIACAIVAGSSLMDFDGIGRTIKGVISKGMRGAVPRTVYTTNAACIPATIAELLCLQAKTLSIQTSCCAGLDAVGHAARMVAEGEVDIAICGGSEAPLFQCPLIELRATGLTPSTTDTPKRLNRPFDLWRTTGVVSEGACMFVIEPDSSPRRGYAYVSGYAYAGDPRGNVCFGLQEAIKHAIADASIKPEQIDAVNAWGPGHRVIDAA